MDWQPIETAPKDGTWVMLYRPHADFGAWDTIVFARWYEDEWAWPQEVFDPYEPPDLDERDDRGFFAHECFTDASNFTHWMPLPAPPEPA